MDNFEYIKHLSFDNKKNQIINDTDIIVLKKNVFNDSAVSKNEWEYITGMTINKANRL